MAERPELPAKPRERRSHAERTAETRSRILGAVVESIAEVGFQRTTAAEVVRRAGVTWGAVQHHFGGKDGLLLAVLEDSFAHFAARLETTPIDGLPLAERAALFLERAWAHFSSPDFRSTFEIMLAYSAREDLEEPPAWPAQMLEAWDRVWQRFFGDCPLPRRERAALQQFVIAALLGNAALRMLEGAAPGAPTGSSRWVIEALVRELEAARAASA